MTRRYVRLANVIALAWTEERDSTGVHAFSLR